MGSPFLGSAATTAVILASAARAVAGITAASASGTSQEAAEQAAAAAVDKEEDQQKDKDHPLIQAENTSAVTIAVSTHNHYLQKLGFTAYYVGPSFLVHGRGGGSELPRFAELWMRLRRKGA